MKKLKKTSTSDLRGKEYIKAYEKAIKVFAKYFDKQVIDYIDYLENNPQMFITVQELKKMSDEDYNNILEEIEAILALGYIAGQNFVEKEIQKQITIGISFDIKFDYAIDWAKQNSGKLIKGINETTQTEISKIITKAIEDGKTLKETTNIIKDKFTQYSQYRASLIATMEVSNAFGEGQYIQHKEYADQFGIPGWKKSLTQGDDNVRLTHISNKEEGRILADKLFNATQTLHEPHGFNCRCTCIYSIVNPDEIK